MTKAMIENPEDYLCENTKKVLDSVIERGLKQDYDSVIVICADKTGVGLGKSDLANLVNSYVAKRVGKQKFTPKYVIFSYMDFLMVEKILKPMYCMNFDEAIELFFSRNVMTREGKKMSMKFAQIRQKRYFMTLCIPSILMLSKWFRGVGQTRINAIWRVTKRGTYICYGKNSGSLDRIRIDSHHNKVVWGRGDYVGRWKKIPKTHPFRKAYGRKKLQHLKEVDENPKTLKKIQREKKRLMNTLTIYEISQIKNVHKQTVKTWIKDGWFGKRGVFKDITGKVRINEKNYSAGIKRLERAKQTDRIPIMVKRQRKLNEKGAKRSKSKKKRR